MTTIYHVAPSGFNIGNQAIQLSLRFLLRQVFGRDVNIVSIPATAKYDGGRAGLSAGVIHEINQFGDGLVIGGGNLFENGELDIDRNALEALQVPAICVGTSWGRVAGRDGMLTRRTDSMSDSDMRALAAACTELVGRDTATVDHLAELGIGNHTLGACPTLFLGDAVTDSLVLPRLGEVGSLISVRNPQLMNVPADLQYRVHQDVSMIADEMAYRTNTDVRILCHDHRDIPFAASLGREWLYASDVREYLSLLASADLNVSYRLHSVLPCLVFGTPFVKVSYDERSLSLMNTIGLADWNINMLEVPSAVGEVLGRLDRLGDLDAVRASTSARLVVLRDVLIRALQRFAAACGVTTLVDNRSEPAELASIS